MKQARVHITDSTDPAPQYERFRFDGIRFYRCTFPKGSSQTYYYPEPVPYALLPSCHFQVSGLMAEPTGVWPDQRAGWMSRAEPFLIPAGTFTRLAMADTIRWCCTGLSNGERTDGVTPVRLEMPNMLTLQAGDSFLLAEGELLTDATVLTAPVRIKATQARSFAPRGTVYGFRWRTL